MDPSLTLESPGPSAELASEQPPLATMARLKTKKKVSDSDSDSATIGLR